MKKAKSSTKTTHIRQKAEMLLKQKSDVKRKPLFEVDTMKLLHELEVHQIELELINNELNSEKERAEISSEKYIELYDFAPTAYFTLSREGEILELNHAASKMLSNDRVSLKNKHFALYVSFPSKPIFNLFLKKVFESNRRETCELCFETKKSTPTFTYLTGTVKENGAQCLITAVDISERKEAEELLKKSELKFRQLADHTIDWEYWIDRDGKYVYLSPSCEHITGYSQEEFISNHKLLFQIVKPEHQACVYQHYKDDNNSSSATHSMEFQIITKNGNEIWIDHNCSPVFDEQGYYLGRRGNNRDITERVKALTELRESEERFKSLFDNLGDAVYVTKLGGQEKGRILEVNPTALKQTGYTRDELLEMNIINDIIIWNSNGPSTSELEEKLLSGGIVTITEKKRKKDGTEFWTEVIISSIEYKGEKASLSINRDISKSKLADQELSDYREHLEELVKKRTTELEEKNTELERFNNLFIGREFRIKELRDKLKEMENKLQIEDL